MDLGPWVAGAAVAAVAALAVRHRALGGADAIVQAVHDDLGRVAVHAATPWAAAALTCVMFLAVKEADWHSFRTRTYDLMVYASALDHPLSPAPLYSEWLKESLLAWHSCLSVYLFVPFRMVFRSPRALMWLQALISAAALVPLLRWACARLGASPLVLALAIAYAGHGAVQEGLRADFHFEVLEPLVLFGALAAHRAGRRTAAGSLLAVALATKEDVGMYVAACGVGTMLERRPGGRALLVSGALAAAVAFLVVMPAFRSGRWLVMSERFGHLGSSVPDMAARGLAHPGETLRPLFSVWTADLLVPLLFLPLLSPRAALPLCGFAILNGLSAAAAQRTYTLHYGLPAVAFLFLGTVDGLARVLERSGPARAQRALMLGLGLVVLGSRGIEIQPPGPAHAALREVVETLPPGKRVAVQDCVLPQLPEGVLGRLLTVELADADLVLIAEGRSTWPLGEDVERLIRRLRGDARWRVSEPRPGVYLFVRS